MKKSDKFILSPCRGPLSVPSVLHLMMARLSFLVVGDYHVVVARLFYLALVAHIALPDNQAALIALVAYRNPNLSLHDLSSLAILDQSYWPHLQKLALKMRMLSLDARKPVFGVSDQVRHKPACTSSEKS